MTRKSPYPTRADYPALIENAKPALRELLEAASYERRIAVLNECSLDVDVYKRQVYCPLR